MALIQSNLENALTSFFEDPPETAALCARKWAEAMSDYALPIIPPTTTAVAASEALAAALTPIFATSLTAAVTSAGMEAAWLVFATSLGTGMLPTWAATPPAGLVGFSGLFAARPLTHREAAANFALSIHLWMTTGTAVNVGTGATVNWS